MKAVLKKTMLAASCVVAFGGMGSSVQAADWLMIQGAEPHGSAGRAKVWGFIQAQYQKDNSDPNAAGDYAPPKLIGPDLDSQSAFNINRARIGVRGTGMPIDPNVNYFLLVEFGNNAITNPGGAFAHVTDASITLNHLKDIVRVRGGMFKVPMAEELYQGIALFDYVNFTEGTNQLLLERLPNRSYTDSDPVGGGGNINLNVQPTASLNGYTKPVAAGRDTGVQLFNSLKVAPSLELGYSLMVGNGNGIEGSDNDDNKDVNFYLSLTKIFGGAGPRRQDWKTFVWYLNGKRSVDGNNDGVYEEYDRKRWGIGTKYYKLPFRVTAEYIKAEGMIFQGPHKPTFILADAADTNPAHPTSGLGSNAEATAWYIEGGWMIPGTKWELDLRYAEYDRMEGTPVEANFENLTYGFQYHFNKKTRMAVNVENRDYSSGNAGLTANLKDVDKRISLQLTHIF